MFIQDCRKAAMVGRPRKVLKLHWMQRLETAPPPLSPPSPPKKNITKKWFKKISYLEFINFRYSDRMPQSKEKLAKTLTYFTIQFCSKSLNSLNIVKTNLSQHSQKPYFTYFQANTSLVGIRENISTRSFLDAKELHYRSTWKANVCIFH